ncbi:bifunctional adenosylcobinamide kinase/adenosylcobinamide-phosphate guanylyltransferase [Bacillus sp. ISL-47]|uniref:bifunctional adenosylcobinamide kinase/adenosylcobinamide-phosphate guanylyltransferase n=1 Tax=Bacillus sp. ISL-47 TaxID=2819130 RepID=UPI001BE8012B|nr:bifunctional adenosylcobinamide kinase/adenosylcobinamide-phosphate guanylyltransferase [Bacillus sp. ISL-47]MBT2689179.1 bifunctional adenosylcobinamide kinase/adenosylcobinamide-phosphate guanylyltransferase [Bacillus sp. ISL-47]MBT2710291.1 bifunctional adenosylcobinamide kinase/adenosylcobinamide-phosphate guanylyltransferase [Pseudomonas sp. ISL-84]
MHFVTGGAFNGKSGWVKKFYNLENIPYQWVSAYKGETVNGFHISGIVVLEGIEVWIRDWLKESDAREVRTRWQNYLRGWLDWEKEDNHRKIVLIGSDISKGIVPMEADDRKWRDVTGWAYQDTAAQSNRVDLIWYGISQKIK